MWSSFEVWRGAQLGVEGKCPSPHTSQLPLSSHSQNRAFRTLLLSSSRRHGCGRRGGLQEETVGASSLPLLLQLTPHLPFLSFPQAGPHSAALAGWGRKMVANEEGEWRELEPGPPLPHFLLCFYTRFWKELGDGS